MTENNRILLKISGEALIGNTEFGLDVKTIKYIANEIKKIYLKGYQICLIIGGGNIFRGIQGASEGIDRSTSDYMGMLATMINALSASLASAYQFNIVYMIRDFPDAVGETIKDLLFLIQCIKESN